MGFLEYKDDSTYKNQFETPHYQSEGQNRMIISTDTEKAFDKIQHFFMIKKLNKTQENYFNIMKAICENP